MQKLVNWQILPQTPRYSRSSRYHIAHLTSLQSHYLHDSLSPRLKISAYAVTSYWYITTITQYRLESLSLMPSCVATVSKHIIVTLAHLQTHICTTLSCCNLQLTQSPSGSLTDTYLCYPLLLQLAADPEPLWLTYRHISILLSHATTGSWYRALPAHSQAYV